jgi:hypothetical protein
MIASRTRAWLAASGIFLLGLAVGVALTVVVGARQMRRTLENPESRPALVDRAAERVGRGLASELGLTAEETALVNAELATAAAAVRRVRLRALADVAREFRGAMQRIGEGLPVEKREAFDRVARERLRRVGLGAMPGGLRRPEGGNRP